MRQIVVDRIILETEAIEEIVLNKKQRDKQFEAVIDDLYDVMLNEYEDSVKAAYRQLLERLYNSKITGKEAGRIIASQMGADWADKVNQNLIDWTGSAYAVGHGEAAAQVGIGGSYTATDRRAIDILNQQNAFWIGEYYDEHVKNTVSNELRRIFVDGAAREDIANSLELLLGEETNRGSAYFRGFSEHTASRLRNMGQVSAYEKARIEYAEVVAILDDRTTDICMEMNGRLIEVSRMIEVRDAILNIETDGKTAEEVRDQMKEIVPFWNDKQTADISGEKTQEIVRNNQGLSMPPYHFRCRSKTVAYFEEESIVQDVEIGKLASDGTKNYFNNLTQQELNNKLRPILKGKYIPYDAKDLDKDTKHRNRFSGTKQQFVNAARQVIKNAEFVGIRLYNFGDPDKLGELQFGFWNKNGEVACSSRGVIKGFFPGDGIKAFMGTDAKEGKKKEFIWLKI